MECLFLPELNENLSAITIDDDEFRHLKALHIRENEQITATNGVGLKAILVIEKLEKRLARCRILSIEFIPEPTCKIGLALGILDCKDRFEFALEKAVELGTTDFYPITGKYSQKQIINLERLAAKAKAAVKQSKRAWNINIHNPISLTELLNIPNTSFYFADMDSHEQLSISPGGENLILVIGAEGGFSPDEEILLRNNQHVKSFTLGNNRLRAETACVAGLSIINYLKPDFGE